MAPSERRRDRGQRTADEAIHRLGIELREARLAAGLSQRALALATGISAAQLSRLERARTRDPSIRTYAVLFSLLGQMLTFRPYPVGTPLRDRPQLRLMARFHALLPVSVPMRTEVGLRRVGDLRAWDGELAAEGRTCKLEAETVIADVQALDRRIGLKMADDGVSVVILLVADTRRNRDALRAAAPLLGLRFPLSMRAVMSELRAGRIPGQSGIVVL